MNFDIRVPQRVTMVVLDDEQPRSCWPTDILAISGRMMTLDGRMSAEISAGLPVRVEWSDYMVLGEIMERQSSEAVTIQIRHAVHIPEIEALRQKWL